METKLQFQKDAKVIGANGFPIGHIDRVVLKPADKTVTHIVVDTGNLIKKAEKVVPVGMVSITTEDQIVLRDEAGDLERMPAFEEKRLVGPDEDMDRSNPSRSTPTMAYGYPVIGAMNEPGSGEKFITRIEQNIPEGTVAMKEGAKVLTAEGSHVGNVERVLAEMPEERITHLLISSGMLTKESRLIPMTWVSIIGENEVHLQVKKDAVKELADTAMVS